MVKRSFEEMKETLKKGAAALRDADIPYLVGGGVAVWAHGGPATGHDLDFFVRPEDAERALAVLVEAGMRPEKPPEGWLYKAWDGDVLVDIVFHPAGGPVTEASIERGEELEILAMPMRVMALEDVIVSKLLALTEQEPDFSRVLEMARAVREKIRWDNVRRRTGDSPFAQAFFVLVEGLGIIPPGETATTSDHSASAGSSADFPAA